MFEFAKPIGEKDPDELPDLVPWSLQDLGFSPLSTTSWEPLPEMT
jgi:hypothetical protein